MLAYCSNVIIPLWYLCSTISEKYVACALQKWDVGCGTRLQTPTFELTVLESRYSCVGD